jgi:hypothetical protein
MLHETPPADAAGSYMHDVEPLAAGLHTNPYGVVLEVEVVELQLDV